MPTPGRPTDELLIQAARDHVRRLFGPSAAPRTITLHINGYDPLTLPVPPEPPAPLAPPEPPFVPNDAQACVLEALAGKALKTTPLSEAAGVNRSQMFRHPGGLQELRDRGLVDLHPRAGYFRPDAPPDELITPDG
jgi:hypothetical protein